MDTAQWGRQNCHMALLDPAVTGLALEAVSDDDFEIFSQALLHQALDLEVEPTGGMHDGGQDGFVRPVKGRPSHFIQISTRKDVKAKILATIARLRSVGRDVAELTFVSNRALNNKDLIEDDVSRESGVSVRIRERRWITLQCQTSESAARIFAERFSKIVNSILQISSQRLEVYSPSERMSILSYLEVHSASEPQEDDLLTLAVDSAIYMALEGTDPDQGVFRTDAEIADFVHEKFPSIVDRKDLSIESRLARLRSKQGVPRIRHHGKEGGYCLPFEVRSDFSQHAQELRTVEVSFWDSMRDRIRSFDGFSEEEIDAGLQAASHAINTTFERQGLNLIASMGGATTYEEVKTFEFIEEKVDELVANRDRGHLVKSAVSDSVRAAFYSGNDSEREYLFRLFKAFSIEFVIRGDDKVGTYFGQLVNSLMLLVGSDIIVRALSETCVRPEGQATHNTLTMLSQAGARLFLPEIVLDEVWGNIHAADLEFRNFYEPWESRITLPEAQNSDRILIRAYFYSKLEPERHAINCRSWDQFLDLFGEARWFRGDGDKDAFAAYLRRKFKLEFIPREGIEKLVSQGRANSLKKRVVKYKKDARLAWNDAYLALYVDELRRRNSETMGDSVYGFRTWWLTEEFNILEAAKEFGIRGNLNMHPQFLMNLFAASPRLSGLTKTFAGIFPTNFGLRITSRVSASTMHRFLAEAVAVANAGEAAASARIRARANALLGLRYRDSQEAGNREITRG